MFKSKLLTYCISLYFYLHLHLHLQMIDSMAEAIKMFNGGVVVISHDFRLLQQVAEEIWVIDKGLHVFDGDIRAYKASLKKIHGYKK